MTHQALDRRISKLERRTDSGGQFHILIAAAGADFNVDAALAERGIEPEPDDHVFVVRLVSPTRRICDVGAEPADDLEKVQPSRRSFLLQ